MADTIDVSGVRVRLEGIDAPETEQSCTDPRGQSGLAVVKATQELRAPAAGCAARGRLRPLPAGARDLLACRALTLNAWMVRQGWALAYGSAGITNRIRTRRRAQARYLGRDFTYPQQCDKAIGDRQEQQRPMGYRSHCSADL